MSYSLFLDDIRNPKTKRNWKIARSFEEAKFIIYDHGIPDYISFDHDLGEGTAKTGYDFAKWLIEYDYQHNIFEKPIEFNVHSANPIGRINIERILENYFEYKFNE